MDAIYEYYRAIWVEWLNALNTLFKDTMKPAEQKALIEKNLDLAPVMKMNAKVEIGLTMRMASVTQREGKLEVGLNVGPIGASGSYGFMSRSTEESVMQVHAAYTMSNNDVTLAEYLDKKNLDLATAEDVNNAVAALEGMNA